MENKISGGEAFYREQSSESIEICGGGEVDGSLPETWAENVERGGTVGTEVQPVLGTVSTIGAV